MALKKSDDVIELPSLIFPPSRGIINRAIRHPILWPRIHMIGVNEPLFLIYYPVLPFYRRRFYGGRFSALLYRRIIPNKKAFLGTRRAKTGDKRSLTSVAFSSSFNLVFIVHG